MATTPISIPFARDGTKTPIDATRPDGSISLTQGYTNDYSRELGVDPAAKAVERDKMNWLLNVLSSNSQDWQISSNPQWIAATQYAPPSVVRYAVGAGVEALYRCIATPAPGVLPTNTTFWEEVPTFATIQGIIPMPFQSIVTAATNFNSFVTNGTWVFDSEAVVSASANSPSGAVAGMLEVRLTGNGTNNLIQRYTGVNGGRYARGRNATGVWAEWVTEQYPVPIVSGGTGATTAAGARTNLGLGTAAVQNIGTSGANVPLLNVSNTWASLQIFAGQVRAQNHNNVANYGRFYGGTGNNFLEYDGSKWAVQNTVSGQYTVIDGGGTTWTSANIDPVRKGGDTMTGQLNGTSAVYSGVVRAIAVQVYGGAYGTQFGVFSRGRNNNVPRWVDVLETDESFSLYCNNPSGGGATQFFNYKSLTAGGVNLATFSASVQAQGYDIGSSLKLKDIEGSLPYGLKEVRQVSTLIGKYKSTYIDDGRRRAFLDADQLADLMPELVDREGVEFNGERVAAIKMEQIAVPLYSAIRELADLVDELRSEIEELKKGH